MIVAMVTQLNKRTPSQKVLIAFQTLK